MKKYVADVVKETTVTAGTGTVALSASTGWARFSDRFANNDRVYYSIRDGSNWEVGYGTYLATNQLARTTILGTLSAGVWANGGTALTLSGQATVRAVVPEAVYTNLWRVEPSLVSGNTQMVAGGCYIVTDTASAVLTLPASPVVGDRVQIAQGGTAVSGVSVSPGVEDINGIAGSMTVDVAEFAFSMIYVDAAYGWKVI